MTGKFSIPPWPNFSEEEANAVKHVLLSNRVNYWTGTECREFEKEFALWVGTEFAVSLANGTVALDVALKALGIGPGDEVIVTPRSFIASASCVVNAGAVPVFADVDLDSQNITAESIAKVLSKKTKAIICVHLAGWPCEMDEIMSLAKEKSLYVIEDCAQAHGAKYKGRSVGSIGHIGAWSFCQDKIMTTGGEGGMVTTNDPSLWRKMWEFKDHGKSYEAMHSPAKSNSFRYVHDSIGTNWRMIEIQAAIGRIQLKRMEKWHAERKRNAEALWKELRRSEYCRVPEPPEYIEHAYYKAYVFLRDEVSSCIDRDVLIQKLNADGLPCFSGSCSEIYLEKAFQRKNLSPAERLPNAKKLGETSLMFLIHPGVDIRNGISIFKKVLSFV